MASSSTVNLQAQINRQSQALSTQNAEICRLRLALRAFILNTPVEPDGDANAHEEAIIPVPVDHLKGDVAAQGEDRLKNDSDEEYSQSDDEEYNEYEYEYEYEEDEGEYYESDECPGDLPEPIDDDGCAMCTACGWEVVEGYCNQCELRHVWDPEKYNQGSFAESPASHRDRVQAKRGVTPLLTPSHQALNLPPDEYLSVKRFEEYRKLLSRGATEKMCETFKLEYTDDAGIVAWLTPWFIDEFGWPDILEEESHIESDKAKSTLWRIHLGRRIELEDADFDGKGFLAELVEDALYFPDPLALWETVKDKRGWVTRLVERSDDDDASYRGSPSGSGGEGPLTGASFAEGESSANPKRNGRPIQAEIIDEYETDSEPEDGFEDKTGDVATHNPGWGIRAHRWETVPANMEIDMDKDSDEDEAMDTDGDEGSDEEWKEPLAFDLIFNDMFRK